MELMAKLQLSNKLWIADLHDIDASTRNSKLISLKTQNQCLLLSQDVIFANSYRQRSPMVTMSLSTEGYVPLVKDLTFVYNTRSCFRSEYTILAGTYWENEIKDKGTIKFYNKYLKNDPTIILHRKFCNKEEDNHNIKMEEDVDDDFAMKAEEVDDILEEETESKWSWKQSYSNFPFLLFTTCKPVINEMSLENRTEIDCIVIWNVLQRNKNIGKAYFLPYGIPDMVGEAGISVFHDQHRNLKGIFMSEKLRDTLIAEDDKKYRYAQEFCIPGFPIDGDQSGLFTAAGDIETHFGIPPEVLSGLGNVLGSHGMPDTIELLSLLALCGDSDSDSSDDMYDYLNSDDNTSDEEYVASDFFDDHHISCTGEIYGPDEKEPALVKLARNGDVTGVNKFIGSNGCSPVVLNTSRKWTEVEEKYGYDKSWDWYDDTALIAASRSGHFTVVQCLLQLGADPSLKSCHQCDTYETALEVAKDLMSKKKKNMDEIIKGTASSYQIPKEDNTKEAALSFLERITDMENIINLLEHINEFWDVAPYSSAHYSNDRQRKMKSSPNLPTDIEVLQRKISEFIPMATVLTQLDELEEAIKKSKVKSTTVNHSNPIINRYGYINNMASSNNNTCRGHMCNMNAASACLHNCCGRCCPGPCKRHNMKDAKKTCYGDGLSRY